MKNQVLKTLLRIVIGSAVVVIGLIALNKFVPAFTLFPNENEEQEKVEVVEKMSDIEEAEPNVIPEQSDFLDLELEEEEATEPVIDLPQSIEPNEIYQAAKRIRVEKLNFVRPKKVMNSVTTKTTINFYDEFCERNVSSYQKEIELRFSLNKIDLAEAILFLAVKTPNEIYYFKPQEGLHNLLKIPNKLPKGSHVVEYGYVLKKDVNLATVPFYRRSCRVVVVD